MDVEVGGCFNKEVEVAGTDRLEAERDVAVTSCFSSPRSSYRSSSDMIRSLYQSWYSGTHSFLDDRGSRSELYLARGRLMVEQLRLASHRTHKDTVRRIFCVII